MTSPPVVYACGFSPWKRPIVRRFLHDARVCFIRRPDRIPLGAKMALWGPRGLEDGGPGEMHELIRSRRLEVLRLEDGFLRSVGLGADLVQPLSWVVDPEGIYYDASRPSGLERLLQETAFGTALLQRAARLRQRVVRTRLTKYNVGQAGWERPAGARSVVLVAGQVESDAALRFGAPGIRTNLDLLRAARCAHPDAYLVYKPHPDVVAGLRARGRDENQAQQWCDEIVPHCGMSEMLDHVDEVHVLTSLTGFEALLRGLRVTTHGQPFYAGWGLTEDRCPVPRRTRQLTLDELVAGALILYPRYADPRSGEPITPEQALEHLLSWREHSKKSDGIVRKAIRSVLRVALARK